MNDYTLAGLAAAVGALITGLFAWLTQSGKSRSEIEVAALQQWKEISQGWVERLNAVERELSDVRREHAAEIETIRRNHANEIEELRRAHRAEMKALREYAEGLERQIAQNSQSGAQLIGDMNKARDSGGGKG